MKTKLLTISTVLLLSLSDVFSQKENMGTSPYGDELTRFPDNHQACVFGDTINVCAEPAKDAFVLDQLLAGDKVTVLATDTAQSTFDGWTALWSKIAYTKAGQRKEGYVWNGLLSPVAKESNGTVFVYNVTSATVENPSQMSQELGQRNRIIRAQVEIRAVQGRRVVSSVAIEWIFFEGFPIPTIASTKDTLGLPPYQTYFCLGFSSNSYAHLYDTTECLWDGVKFTLLPELSSGSPLYQHDCKERYIFPSDEDGYEGKILYESECYGYLGPGEFEITRRVRAMIWDGKNFQKPD